MFLEHETIPSVSVLIPMHNEKKTVLKTIRNVLKNDYPKINIILINDGSTDGTLYHLKENLSLKLDDSMPLSDLNSYEVTALYQSRRYKNIKVIDKFNKGFKADALNAGLNYSKDDLILTIDADTILTKDAISKLVIPMFFYDGNYIGVGGALLTQNSCLSLNKRRNNLFELFQLIEYLRAFLIGRVAMNFFGGNFINSGAVSLFAREAINKEGGFNTNAIGEDMDIVMQIYKNNPKAKIFYIPDTVGYTMVPHKTSDLVSQRDRWYRGLIRCLFDHREILIKFNQGKRSFFTFPYFLLVEMFSAFVEFSAYPFLILAVMDKKLDFDLFIFLFIMSTCINVLITAISVFYEKTKFDNIKNSKLSATLIIISIIEFLGYRQILLYAKIVGAIKIFEEIFFRKVFSWETLERRY